MYSFITPEIKLERAFLSNYDLNTGYEIIVNCGIYSHVAVILGNYLGRVYITENQKGLGVRHITLGKFLSDYKGRPMTVRKNYLGVEAQKTLVWRASQEKGNPYSLLEHNCEHYANGLIRGKKVSGQLQGGMFLLAVGLVVMAVARP